MTVKSQDTSLSNGNFFYITIFGFLIVKIIMSFAQQYTLKLTEMELIGFSVKVVLMLLSIYLTGLYNVNFSKNRGIILLSYVLGLITIIVWVQMKRYFPIYGNDDISQLLYYFVFFVLSFFALLFTTFQVVRTEPNSLLSYFIYVFVVYLLYILIIMSRKSEWGQNTGESSLSHSCFTYSDIVNDKDHVLLKNKKECNDTEKNPYGCCPHEILPKSRANIVGSNCRLYQKQVINKNYGIIFWIVSVLFVYDENDRNITANGLLKITLALNMFVVGLFIGFSAIYEVQYPLKTITYNFYPINKDDELPNDPNDNPDLPDESV